MHVLLLWGLILAVDVKSFVSQLLIFYIFNEGIQTSNFSTLIISIKKIYNNNNNKYKGRIPPFTPK